MLSSCCWWRRPAARAEYLNDHPSGRRSTLFLLMNEIPLTGLACSALPTINISAHACTGTWPRLSWWECCWNVVSSLAQHGRTEGTRIPRRRGTQPYCCLIVAQLDWFVFLMVHIRATMLLLQGNHQGPTSTRYSNRTRIFFLLLEPGFFSKIIE